MKLGKIFGRTVAYVPLANLMKEDDTVAEFFPCEDQDFDIIFFDPEFKDQAQAIIHEEIHGVMNRTGIVQTSITQDVIEVICENVATYIAEAYELKRKPIK
jgi:16S rRNA G966 N2-methylase RsmD